VGLALRGHRYKHGHTVEEDVLNLVCFHIDSQHGESSFARARDKRRLAINFGQLHAGVRWQRVPENGRVTQHERYYHVTPRLLFFDCGSHDQYLLHFGARLLARKLTHVGIPHEYEEFDDNHTNIAYRYNVSLPRMANVLWESTT